VISAQRTVSAAGVLTGLAVAALLVIATHVPASSRPLGADVRVTVTPPGELRVERGGVLLAARDLLAGSAARGGVRIRNIAGGAVRVRFCVGARRHDLDSALELSLRAGRRTLAVGALGELRRASRPLRIPRGGARTIAARAWLDPSASGYEGRSAQVAIRPRVQVAR